MAGRLERDVVLAYIIQQYGSIRSFPSHQDAAKWIRLDSNYYIELEKRSLS